MHFFVHIRGAFMKIFYRPTKSKDVVCQRMEMYHILSVYDAIKA